MNTYRFRSGRHACFLFIVSCFLARAAFADYTVTGRFKYVDRGFDSNGFTGATFDRPIRFADVQIMAGTTKLVQGATDADGNFSIVVPGSTQQQIKATCLAASQNFKLQVVNSVSATSFGSPWSLSTNPITYSGQSSLAMGDSTASAISSEGKAFNIWDALIDGVEFIGNLRGSNPADLFTVVWSASYQAFGGCYDPARKFAYIGQNNAQDDPVVYQQYGHFIADLYSEIDLIATFPYSQLYQSVVFQALSGDQQDIRAAWAEGLSLFLGASIRQFKGYSRADSYFLSNGTIALLTFDLESVNTYINPLFTYPSFKTNRGDTSILAVASALWDITDGATGDDGSPGVDDDSLQRSFSDVWRVLDHLSRQTFPGFTMERFWDAWFSPAINNGSAGEMSAIFLNQGIEYAADNQEPDGSPESARLVTAAQLPAPTSDVKIVINEISIQDGGAIELYNAGAMDVDLGNWTLSAIQGGTTAWATLPAFTLRPGQFVTFVGRNAWGRDKLLFPGTSSIPWKSGMDGACVLRDSSGMGHDFARWGGSREFPPGGTSWTAGRDPSIPNQGSNLGRNFASRDTDSGADWTSSQVPTIGTHNLSGEEQHHTFFSADDTDLAAFNAKGGMRYLVEALNVGNGADTLLELLSADGLTVLSSNDDSSLGAGSQILWKAPADGKYVIRCKRYDGPANYARYGSYDLRVIESSILIAAGQADTLTVSKPDQGGRFNTIAEAISNAYDGDTIEIIDGGTYQENVGIFKSITLRAQRGKTPKIDVRGVNQIALYLNGKNVRIESLTILGGSYGIAVLGGSATVVNTIVARSSTTGIIVQGEGVTANIVHCTIANSGASGLTVALNATVKVLNSISYGQSSNDLCEVDQSGKVCLAAGAAGARMTVRNTLSVKSSYTKDNGNITGDPKFENAGTNDYHLQSSSPAVDKADMTDPDVPGRDADGLARNLPGSGSTSAPDMGAYEYLNPAILTATAVFPQIAAGGTNPDPEYRTSIVAVNTGAQTASVRISLTKSNGNALDARVLNSIPSEDSMNGGNQGEAFSQTGGEFDISVMPSGTFRLETAGPASTTAGYARLLSNLPLNGTALFKAMEGSRIRSEAGVGLSTPSTSFIVYIDNRSNARSGYAVANTGSLAANITMTLRDSSGQTRPGVLAGACSQQRLEPGQHFACFAFQDFDAAGADFEGSVEFSSDQPVSAVALRYDNWNASALDQVFSTIPVLANQAATTLYFPQVADGGTYRTNFILVNPSATSTTARLEFYDSNGNPLALSIGGTASTTYDVSVLPAHGVARLLTDGTAPNVSVGWVKVTAPVAIGGSAIFQTLNGTTITSEAGVASSPATSQFVVYVETIAAAMSGLAISNPNGSAANITIRLRNSSGVQVDTYNLNLPARGHVAKFFTQWFGSYSQFEGTLEVVASAPVSAVALRYDGPLFATLPVILP